MISPRALNSLCFPWLLVDHLGGLIDQGNGSLFKQPTYDFNSVLATSTSMANGGWAVCPNGFALYKFSTAIVEPACVVLHGLKVQGLSTAKGKSEQLSINLSQADVISYINGYCTSLEALDDQYRALIRQNIHEVRGINSALYNTAFELQELLDNDFSIRGPFASLAKSVVSLSELLRGRVDFMDFIANPNTKNVSRGDIYVYRKFDKVQRCFRVTANKRGIEFSISGSSSKATYGPPIFDLVPYLLLDNAVKYSPDKYPVKIVCNDGVSTIFCSVTSRGPRIDSSELADIFSAGFRGVNALKSNKEGSGLGLSVLKTIVDEVFRGSIAVTQSEDKAVTNGVPYCDVTFEIKFPTKA